MAGAQQRKRGSGMKSWTTNNTAHCLSNWQTVTDSWHILLNRGLCLWQDAAHPSVISQGLVDVFTSTSGSEIVRHERSYCVTSMHVSFAHRHILMSWLMKLCCLDPIINILPAFILGGLVLHGNVPHIDYFQQIVLISIRPAFIPNH